MSYCCGVGQAILKLYYMCYWIKQRNECAGPTGPRVPLWKEGHANMTSGKKRKTLEGMDWNWGGGVWLCPHKEVKKERHPLSVENMIQSQVLNPGLQGNQGC